MHLPWKNEPWKPWWIVLWIVVAVGLIALAFFVPFKQWALATTVGFGLMEAIGLLKKDDAYPPLTHVIREYLKRWMAFPLIYGFTGAAGSVWLKFPHPVRIGALFALLGWFTSHFDETYDQVDK